MHIFNVKLPFYPSCEVKYGLQNRVSTDGYTDLKGYICPTGCIDPKCYICHNGCIDLERYIWPNRYIVLEKYMFVSHTKHTQRKK